MSWNRSPLGQVRGLGAAHGGTHHHIASRVTSVALALLTPWFILSVALTMEPGFLGARAWATQPLNAVLTAILVVVSLYHAGLGMRVVIEDYIHRISTKHLLMLLNLFVWSAAALAGLYAVLQISFGS